MHAYACGQVRGRRLFFTQTLGKPLRVFEMHGASIRCSRSSLAKADAYSWCRILSELPGVWYCAPKLVFPKIILRQSVTTFCIQLRNMIVIPCVKSTIGSRNRHRWMPQYRARMVTSLDLLHMAELSDTSKTLTFEQLVELREKTEVISQFLHKRLKVYVETLRLLLAPGRLLGKYVGVKEDVLGADKALAQLRELYRGVCGKPFALSAELDEGPLKLLDIIGNSIYAGKSVYSVYA
jgi:hypothetical protein